MIYISQCDSTTTRVRCKIVHFEQSLDSLVKKAKTQCIPHGEVPNRHSQTYYRIQSISKYAILQIAEQLQSTNSKAYLFVGLQLQ